MTKLINLNLHLSFRDTKRNKNTMILKNNMNTILNGRNDIKITTKRNENILMHTKENAIEKILKKNDKEDVNITIGTKNKEEHTINKEKNFLKNMNTHDRENEKRNWLRNLVLNVLSVAITNISVHLIFTIKTLTKKNIMVHGNEKPLIKKSKVETLFCSVQIVIG